ncbi:MAG: signal recognition particle protein [Planctomycetes bacterium]|nr:signal recognition particle protein [Planctomycetota bacterium]
MFDSLTESLGGIFRKLAGRGHLSEKNIQEGLKEVRMALLQADVSFKVVKDFIDRVSVKAVGEEVIKSVRPADQIVWIVHQELTALMGPVDHAIPPAGKTPTIIMMAGLQGSGKTTTTAKLGQYLRKKGRKPMLIAADMIRPAAVEQLKTLGAQNSLPVYWEATGRPVKICERGIAKAVEQGLDAVVLDTQGRLHVDREMMDELKEVREKLKPPQIYHVVDAMTGQDAVKSAAEFNAQLELDGVIMTKLDGDARGGAALSVKAVTGKPIKFVGLGEKIDALDEFHPERMASRILGMGDVISLVEKAKENVDQDKARKLQEKIRKDELTIADFYEQLQQMKKMGPLKQLMKLLPGQLGQMADEVDEDELKYAEAIIQSMTKQERENPELLNASRRQRIARGSGRPVHEVNSLVKQYVEARKMIRVMKKQGGFGGLFKP